MGCGVAKSNQFHTKKGGKGRPNLTVGSLDHWPLCSTTAVFKVGVTGILQWGRKNVEFFLFLFFLYKK